MIIIKNNIENGFFMDEVITDSSKFIDFFKHIRYPMEMNVRRELCKPHRIEGRLTINMVNLRLAFYIELSFVD